MRNRKAQKSNTNVFMWIAIIAVIAYVANFGGFGDTVNGLFSGSDSDANVDTGISTSALAQCPTDGTSTYTLNTQDALTATATDTNGQYYVFNGNKLIKSGNVAGSTTFDVACGKDYSVLLINETTGTGSYGQVINLKARISDDTINAQVTRFGTARILSLTNPADTASRRSNCTLGAGSVCNFDLTFVANLTERGYNKPLILCEAPISNISSVTLADSFSNGKSVETAVLPTRITPTAAERYYVWGYPDMISPKDGPISVRGTITAQAGTDPNAAADMTCVLADQAQWGTASFKTSTSIAEGFPTGAENTENQNDIGGPDATASSFNFENEGGF